ncbi:DUF6298 domain-containing protein [Paraflavisolibacter sp. H34]|uniref:DUF6298 domain-containing protein n=1 Tax=Huijunlia imazamoxiresistens TaxID=3127457 RepID=UPI00301A5D5F
MTPHFLRKNSPVFLTLASWALLTHTAQAQTASGTQTAPAAPAAAAAKKAKPVPPPPPVTAGAGGRLVYTPDALGNRVPDFSYSGYKAGAAAIPNVPVRIVVPVANGDATARIQAALDYVAALPADKDGFRGAVLLQKGVYEVWGGLKLSASGVVLRGSGMGEDGTVLLGAGIDRQTLVSVAGKGDQTLGPSIAVTGGYVPVNATKIKVADVSGIKAGDKILVQRPSTREWIDLLGTDHFGGGETALGWKPGARNVSWDRTVLAVNGNELTLDAPLTTALDPAYGGGTVAVYQWPGRISGAGVEHLRLRSTFDKNNQKDENHRWMAVTLENIADAWVRQVVFEHFAGSAVAVLESASRVTVEDCKSLAPVSEIGGQRRYTFYTSGQQTLFQRCYAERGFHDFAAGFAATLNAFVQCQSDRPYSFSGTIDSWASGILFDIVNVDGQALRYANRGQDGAGAGWTAANSVFWQCSAALVECPAPPTATNWAFGTWSQFAGNGHWESSNEHIRPRSLYYAQLVDRLGDSTRGRVQLLPVESEASSSPPVEVAMKLTRQAVDPAPLLTDFIDAAATRNPIPVNSEAVKTIDQVKTSARPAFVGAPAMRVLNGWLVRGGQPVIGGRMNEPWWRGNVRPDGIRAASPAITRYVPGRTGTGLTDDLNALTDTMALRRRVVLEHNYGLWYERRRDDHERIRRMDGEVWPPFYEQPFARSGQESGYDGLSKYDLTKYNPWYWSRLKQFADLADQKGLVLVHQNYFQHNIIEAGAHYADFPWRPANNINNTGFPEPVPYAGDKRVFLADQFYDVNHPVRRPLHRAYIRQCLENFKNNSGVIQLVSEEYTGPAHFVRFWLDVINEWETETGKQEIIGLSTTKDVQDSILADPARAAVVDLIDIRYWHYQPDGSAYAPAGGQNLAPRQHARLLKPKRTTFEQVYRAVREYKQKFPDKAVLFSADGWDAFGWASFMAGGSLATIPAIAHPGFLAAASSMRPLDLPGAAKGVLALGNKDREYIIYNEDDAPVSVDLSGVKATYKARWIDTRSGALLKEQKVKGGSALELKAPKKGALLWLARN